MLGFDIFDLQGKVERSERVTEGKLSQLRSIDS